VEYVRINFPENFSDYIDSSEFIAILELLAYLAQSLSFRMDLNSRENFLETAERRDSVFNLARMLGYNPKRNVAASGLMKIVSVKTNEPLKDSLGTELNNRKIFWDDSNNSESYEQFLTVINAAMDSTNRFTSPIKSGEVADIQTELYRFNVQLGTPIAFPFSLNVNGVQRNFEIVNANFNDGKTFYEMHPDPLNKFGMVYRNDGKGLSSDNSGFFMQFKQGVLSFKDYNYTAPIPNRTQDLAIRNINETDVYVQEINTTNSVLNKWEKIPNTIGQTLNFNSKALGTRNLYAVENINNDGIRIKFPDGNFGNIPTGIYRVYHRVSDPDRFSVQPDDARNVTISVPYQNAKGQNYTLSLEMSLKSTVNNSLEAESLTSIKENAPQTYYTQNRMVSAQDYNVFPFAQSTNIQKLTAINRTHAGHSRYIDINDPTGTFQNIDLYASDGTIYKEDKQASSTLQINASNTTSEVIANKVPLLLKTQTLNNFVYDGMRKAWTAYVSNKFDLSSLNVRWKALPAEPISATGYMTETTSDVGGETNIMINSVLNFTWFQENNFIRYVDVSDISNYKWVRITAVTNGGALSSGLSTSVGPWTVSAEITDNWRADEVIVTLRKTFSDIEALAIKDQMDGKKTFGLGYNIELDNYYIIENKDLDKTSPFSIINAQDVSGTSVDASWLLLFNYIPGSSSSSYSYSIDIRGEQYVIQSAAEMKFYNIKNVKVTDTDNKANSDRITITTLNNKPGSAEVLKWSDSVGDDNVGESWLSSETGAFHTPVGFDTNIPLRTRSTKWHDLSVAWKDNFGIYRGLAGTSAAAISSNIFVNEATIPINTYFDDGTADAINPNVTIANNTGIIQRLPSNFTVRFDSTTFGFNPYLDTGNIIYKDYNPATGVVEIFQSAIGGVSKSFGTDGATYNAASSGKIIVASGNATAITGNLTITGTENNNNTFVTDSSLKRSVTSLIIGYDTFDERLDEEIEWHVVDTFKYDDGYTDARKIIISPLDTDGDLVPDRPLQFDEYADSNDLAIFEYYTDFDGYTYDRPISAAILDLRSENQIVVDFSADTIGPVSHVDPTSYLILDWVLLKNSDHVMELENSTGKASGLIAYAEAEQIVYVLTPSSTNINQIAAIESDDYIVRNGRGLVQNTLASELTPMIFKWKHVASKDVRIDPSVSNVVEMLVLTKSYYEDVQKYINVPGTSFPESPTSRQLANEFESLSEFKNASDSLIFRSGKVKLLFGDDADTPVQARFKIVKLSDELSDNELKSGVIRAINTYFAADNWEFGETFYFTELSSYIHQQLGSAIGSIVIIPKNSAGQFGDLFQVKADPDELFISTATTNDIEIITKITSQTLRADR
jgi:hypothetical protein